MFFWLWNLIFTYISLRGGTAVFLFCYDNSKISVAAVTKTAYLLLRIPSRSTWTFCYMLYSITKLGSRRGTSTVPSFIVKQPQVCNLFWCFLRGLRVRGVTPNTQWIKNSIWDNVISIWVGFHTTKFLALRVGKTRGAQKHHSKACNTTSLHFSSSHRSSLSQT